MILNIRIEFDNTGCGTIYCPEARSEFPTKNPVTDVANLLAEALDRSEANEADDPVTYPALPQMCHSENARKELPKVLALIQRDPRSTSRERALADCILALHRSAPHS